MLKGQKTRIFGVLVILLGLLEALDPSMVATLVPVDYQWAITPAIGFLIIVLRQITTTPPGRQIDHPDDFDVNGGFNGNP